MKKEEIIELLGNKLTEVIKISPFDCISITQEQTQEIIQSLSEPTQEGVVSAEEVLKAANDLDKSNFRHFKREHTNKEFYDNVVDGFIEGAKWMHTYASQTREEDQKEVDKPTAKRLWEMAKEITDLQRKAKELPTDNVMWNWLEEDWFDWLEENFLKLNPNDLREEELKKHAVGFHKWVVNSHYLYYDGKYSKPNEAGFDFYSLEQLYNEYLEQK